MIGFKKTSLVCFLIAVAVVSIFIFKYKDVYFRKAVFIPDLKAENISAVNAYGFAWSKNTGWISFSSTNCNSNGDNFTEGGINNTNYPQCPDGAPSNISYGVALSADNTLSGYAWSDNIGWISFWGADVVGCPRGACQSRLIGSDFWGWARALSSGAGWDGWISLNSDNCDIDGNTYIDIACGGANDATTPIKPYKVSKNGEDFSGFAWGGAVVGWISFNRLNCDTNNDGKVDNGDCGGDGSKEIKPYKVTIPNISPVVDTLAVYAPSITDLCVKIPPEYKFSWNYIDFGDQSRYELQIDKNPDFSSPTVNIGFNSSLNYQFVPLGSALDSSYSNLLSYQNTIYYWQVRVFDDLGADSGWKYGGEFTTPDHMYPSQKITCSPDLGKTCPSNHSLLETVQFEDNSICYDSSNASKACAVLAWDFDGGGTDSTISNPTYKYNTIGLHPLIFRAGDGTFTCPSISYPIEIEETINPMWAEVVPK